jgi:hypothetical protein
VTRSLWLILLLTRQPYAFLPSAYDWPGCGLVSMVNGVVVAHDDGWTPHSMWMVVYRSIALLTWLDSYCSSYFWLTPELSAQGPIYPRWWGRPPDLPPWRHSPKQMFVNLFSNVPFQPHHRSASYSLYTSFVQFYTYLSRLQFLFYLLFPFGKIRIYINALFLLCSKCEYNECHLLTDLNQVQCKSNFICTITCVSFILVATRYKNMS